MKNKKKEIGLGCGIMLAFGFPAIVWIYFDWKAALAFFVISQSGLMFLQSITLKDK